MDISVPPQIVISATPCAGLLPGHLDGTTIAIGTMNALVHEADHCADADLVVPARRTSEPTWSAESFGAAAESC